MPAQRRDLRDTGRQPLCAGLSFDAAGSRARPVAPQRYAFAATPPSFPPSVVPAGIFVNWRSVSAGSVCPAPRCRCCSATSPGPLTRVTRRPVNPVVNCRVLSLVNRRPAHSSRPSSACRRPCLSPPTTIRLLSYSRRCQRQIGEL